MSDIETLRSLKARIDAATGPSEALDRAIGVAIAPDAIQFFWWPRFTASIDAALALVEKVLPGWWWTCGTCCVSDDAAMAPDFNSPVHGERLHEEIGPFEQHSIWDAGVDVDRRPPGNLPLALLQAMLEALIALEEHKENRTAQAEAKEPA